LIWKSIFFALITAHQSNELNPGVERKYGTFSPRKKRKVSKKCDQFTPNTLEMFSSMVLKCYLNSYSQKAQVITTLFLPFLAVTNTNLFFIKYLFLHYLGFYLLIPPTQFNNEEFSFNHILTSILHQCLLFFLEAPSTHIYCFFNDINFIIYSFLSL
jgi:hypothetical protein